VRARGHGFERGPTLIAPALAPEVAVKARAVMSGMNLLMTEGGVIASGVAECLEWRHADVIVRDGIAGMLPPWMTCTPVAAVIHSVYSFRALFGGISRVARSGGPVLFAHKAKLVFAATFGTSPLHSSSPHK
jgi:hypothetical protein